MEIAFADAKFAKECNDSKLLQKRQGPARAKLIRRRLDELRAAAVLGDISHLKPPRLHRLSNRNHEYSVDLDHPYRLIIRPIDEPLPLKPDGGLDLGKIKSVCVLGVEDTHD